MLTRNTILKYLLIVLMSGITGCSKWLSVTPPPTQSLSSDVFSNASSTESAIAGMYSYMYEMNNVNSTFGGYHLSICTGLSADELFLPGSPSDPFFMNKLSKDNQDMESIWASAYAAIYSANAIIEGVENSKSLTPLQINQAMGEALFIRAFAHFYLINLFGDIPLIKSTDVNSSQHVGRTPVDSIYHFLIADLLQAQAILPDDYAIFSNERVRANKWVAAALLSRIYLYRNMWTEAEKESTQIIDRTDLFILEPVLENVFLKTSREAIWQFQSFGGQGFTTVGNWFNNSESDPPVYAMSDYLTSAFEPADKRIGSWIRTQIINQDSFYVPFKYKNNSGNIVNDGEYDMVFRLAEMYLIRAESRAHQGDLSGADGDLNTIRLRAGLNEILSSQEDSVLSAIAKERQTELFSEWGHRWFDLKRRNQINEILGTEKPNWSPDDSLFPIPLNEIGKNSSLTQNPGY